MSLLILLLILFNFFIGDFLPESKQDKKEVKLLLAELEETQDSIDRIKAISTYANSDKRSSNSKSGLDSIEFFNFNPNGLIIDDWLALGLSLEQAEVIKNYENKGGQFRIKADVEKMYTISEEHYQKLKPYIQLPDELEEKKSYDKNKGRKSKKEWKPIIKDINLADSAELTEVFGIGPFFAGKIVEHREKLGGYIAKKQLVEIWKFSDSMLIKLDSTLIISEVEPRKMNINTTAADELKNHPYISWSIANSIVSIREQHGKYQKLDEIKKSVLIDDSLFIQLSPYLKIND
jgi:DNA uptake protein ComE-like DNA-binding protein